MFVWSNILRSAGGKDEANKADKIDFRSRSGSRKTELPRRAGGFPLSFLIW
jgi:hypothetical protein